MAFQIDIMTLFPEMINSVMSESIIGRAAAKGIIEINAVQIRDYTENKQNQVDDYPYGGGFGCVMMAQPLKSCLDDIKEKNRGKNTHVIYMSPQGKTFNQDKARQLLRDYDHIVLVCGHYEGIDERFIEKCVDEEISVGDFVLTGGEIAAMAVSDCICRMVPGVLSDAECYTGESHWEKLLEYPQYTRPDSWEGLEVPEILRKGNHADITTWRRKQMLMRTMEKRPDVYAQFTPTEEDEKLIRQIERDKKRLKLTAPVTTVKASSEDLESIMLCVRQSRNYLKKNRTDQWQSEYPSEEYMEKLINSGMMYIVKYQEKLAGIYCLSNEGKMELMDITDGKWTDDSCFLNITLIAVAAEFRGSGLSDIIFSDIIKQARDNGFSSVKASIHRKNKPVMNALKKAGFSYRGNLLTYEEPYHDPRRQGFEISFKR